MVVHDLTGTSVTTVNVNLGSNDGAPDSVTVEGTAGADVISVSSDQAGVVVAGLHTQVNITGAESANDRLIINAGDGDDVVSAGGLAANAIGLVANGGNGNDVLIDGAGNDVLTGGLGNTVVIQ